MKKFLIVIPTIITLLIFSCVPSISAYASVDLTGSAEPYYELDQILSHPDIAPFVTSDCHYILSQHSVYNSFRDLEGIRVYFLLIPSDVEYSTQFDEENDHLFISCSSNFYFFSQTFYSYYDFNDPRGRLSLTRLSYHRIDYFLNERFIFNGFNESVSGEYGEEYRISNIEPIATSPKGLVVDSVYPEFSGDTNKTFTYNDIAAEIAYPQIRVTNNSNTSYQFMWVFVKKGQSLQWANGESSAYGVGCYPFTHSVDFAFISDEYVRIKRSSNSSSNLLSDLNSNIRYTDAYVSSVWHFIKPGQSLTPFVPWEMMPFVTGEEYDMYVIGAKVGSFTSGFIDGDGNIDENSPHFTSEAIDPFIGYYEPDKLETAHFSTFRWIGDNTYNSNSECNSEGFPHNQFGNIYPYSSDSVKNSSIFNSIYGERDEEGNITISNDRFNKKIPSVNFPNSISNNFDSGNNLSSFSGYFSQFFGMMSIFFDSLPLPFMSVFLFGFTSLIIIAIIKAVR